MKEFSKFSEAHELEPHYQMQFNVIPQEKNSILAIDGTLTDTTNLGHSGNGINDNEKVLQIPKKLLNLKLF